MITNRAIEFMEETARSVGFGSRDDYPHLGASPMSAGDWKGNSVAVCVFTDYERAEKYLVACTDGLIALGSDLKGVVRKLPPPDSWNDGHYLAVLTGIDIAKAIEYCRHCPFSIDDNIVDVANGICGRCSGIKGPLGYIVTNKIRQLGLTPRQQLCAEAAVRVGYDETTGEIVLTRKELAEELPHWPSQKLDDVLAELSQINVMPVIKKGHGRHPSRRALVLPSPENQEG